jgi:hypothetical protein
MPSTPPLTSVRVSLYGRMAAIASARSPVQKPQNAKMRIAVFDDDAPRVVLATARMVDLGALLEALLREIAKALANGESDDEQAHS